MPHVCTVAAPPLVPVRHQQQTHRSMQPKPAVKRPGQEHKLHMCHAADGVFRGLAAAEPFLVCCHLPAITAGAPM